jgi:hypothetical protein
LKSLSHVTLSRHVMGMARAAVQQQRTRHPEHLFQLLPHEVGFGFNVETLPPYWCWRVPAGGLRWGCDVT